MTFETVVHGISIVVGCYGAANDWLCRFSLPPRDEQRSDAYKPQPELGFVWIREDDGWWLATGKVAREVFWDADTVDGVLEQIMRDVVRQDWSLTQCIEFVDTQSTITNDGEEGRLWWRWGRVPRISPPIVVEELRSGNEPMGTVLLLSLPKEAAQQQHQALEMLLVRLYAIENGWEVESAKWEAVAQGFVASRLESLPSHDKAVLVQVKDKWQWLFEHITKKGAEPYLRGFCRNGEWVERVDSSFEDVVEAVLVIGEWNRFEAFLVNKTQYRLFVWATSA
jgi:hypothetical protein